MDVAIGFDTSCYTTSAAAVDAKGNVIAFQRMLLPVQHGQRGLRQSEAVFAHVRQLPKLMQAMQADLASVSVKVVAASTQPIATDDSYMPVFTVGEGHAATLASVLKVPLVKVSHQQGHIAAGQIGNAPLAERFVALHISGGTTDVLLSTNGILTLLGSSLDLHAGQLIDRVGVAMGLPFPAGPALERLAVDTRDTATALLPASLEKGNLSCHLSGAETQCQRWIASASYAYGRIAAEIFDLLARTCSRMLAAAFEKTQTNEALVVGGVASSMLFRKLLTQRLAKLNRNGKVCFGKPEYSADNAAGVAWLGMQQFLNTSKR